MALCEVGGVEREATLVPQHRRRDEEGRGREEQQQHPARVDERGPDEKRGSAQIERRHAKNGLRSSSLSS